MEKYRIRAKEIKEKMKYVKEILKRELSSEEEEKVKISLFSYLALLNESTNIQLSNFLNQITRGKYSQKGRQECADLESTIVNDYIEGYDYVDDEYLGFLIDLVNNVAVPGVEEPTFATINISSEQLMKMSTIFYNSLGNDEIKQGFSQISSKPNSISITPKPISEESSFSMGGFCLYDHVYHQPYVTSYKHNNIKDFLILNHELMHGIDFLMLEKLYSKTYTGFHETPTYTCDYLTFDFLGQMGFDKNEVQKLKYEKEAYFCGLASQVQFVLNRRLRKKGIDMTQGYTFEDLKSIIDFDMMKKMLEVESAVLSYGFYQQIKNDKQQGLTNLTRFMSSNIPKDRAPDFTSFGLSNDVLLELSKKITLEQKQQKQLENSETIEQQNQLQQTNGYVRKLVKPSVHSRAFISSGLLVILISAISVMLSIFLLAITK